MICLSRQEFVLGNEIEQNHMHTQCSTLWRIANKAETHRYGSNEADDYCSFPSGLPL